MSNYSIAVLVINAKCRAVRGTYEPDPVEGRETIKRVLYKTFDPSIKVGDICVVPSDTRHKFTTVKITHVDVDDYDLDDTTPVDWIVTRVDQDNYKQMLAQEGEAVNLMRAGEKQKKREALREQFMVGQDEKILALPIATHVEEPK